MLTSLDFYIYGFTHMKNEKLNVDLKEKLAVMIFVPNWILSKKN